MSQAIIIAGIGIALFIIVYMLFKLKSDTADGNNHFLLQLLLILLLVFGMPLVGKIVIDNNQECSWLAVNSTVTGAITSYDYDYYCEAIPNTTALVFYKYTLWFARLVGLYIFSYIAYSVLLFLGWVVPKNDE